ncbi:hypothetical protein D6C13_03525 [Rahnella woolbedingensis]|uniref:Uncharacterized protein n=1 Tax=Rahnella woolbedingensis TaxID=1510574 RepID=A0A419NE26_9GAMM|nr:hypothetical protein D6C13_03525 [Rahnella woolbedingensis]
MPVTTATAASSVEIFIFCSLTFNHQSLWSLSGAEYDFQAKKGQAEERVNARHYAKYRKETGFEGIRIDKKSKKKRHPEGYRLRSL